MFKFALFAPVDEGLKATWIEHVSEAVREAPVQLLLLTMNSVEFAPEMLALVIVREPVPVLLTVK